MLENSYVAFLIIKDETGEVKTITAENFKGIIEDCECSIESSEIDNDLLDERFEELAEAWYNTEVKTSEKWEEFNAKANSYTEQKNENKEEIKKCENTIKIIETYAEVNGWT